MSDFKAKIYQNRFRLASAPDPAWGASALPQNPSLEYIGDLLLRKGKGEGRGRVGEGRKGS